MNWPHRWSVLYTDKVQLDQMMHKTKNSFQPHRKHPSWLDGEVHINENQTNGILVDSGTFCRRFQIFSLCLLGFTVKLLLVI